MQDFIIFFNFKYKGLKVETKVYTKSNSDCFTFGVEYEKELIKDTIDYMLVYMLKYLQIDNNRITVEISNNNSVFVEIVK